MVKICVIAFKVAEKNVDKFTAQQIIRQQILNKQLQQMKQQAQQQNKPIEDMAVQASDQFWSTLQTRGQENLERVQNGVPMDNVKNKLNNMLFDTLANINNNQQQLQRNQDLQSLGKSLKPIYWLKHCKGFQMM